MVDHIYIRIYTTLGSSENHPLKSAVHTGGDMWSFLSVDSSCSQDTGKGSWVFWSFYSKNRRTDRQLHFCLDSRPSLDPLSPKSNNPFACEHHNGMRYSSKVFTSKSCSRLGKRAKNQRLLWKNTSWRHAKAVQFPNFETRSLEYPKLWIKRHEILDGFRTAFWNVLTWYPKYHSTRISC